MRVSGDTVEATRVLLVAMALAAVVGLVDLPAQALTIESLAFYEVNTSTGLLMEQDGPHTGDISGPYWVSSHVSFDSVDPGGTAPTEEDGESGSSFDSSGSARSSANVWGDLAGDAWVNMEDDVVAMHFEGVASWSHNYVNTGDPLQYYLDYSFVGGWVSLFQEGGAAAFSLEILLDDETIWSTAASLLGNPSSNCVVLEVGDELADYEVDDSGDLYRVWFNPFDGQLALGTFGSDHDFEITYNLGVGVSVASLGGSAQAGVGDPYGVMGEGFSGVVSSVPISEVIPEPGTMALLGLGLVGLGLRRVRARG